MLTIFSALIVLSELFFASAVYVSVAAPDRVPLWLRNTPLTWRLGTLFVWSVMAGAVIQLMGVTHPLR